MPSTSKAQERLMNAVAHGWVPKGGRPVPLAVAQEFHKADRRKKGRLEGMQYRGRERRGS